MLDFRPARGGGPKANDDTGNSSFSPPAGALAGAAMGVHARRYTRSLDIKLWPVFYPMLSVNSKSQMLSSYQSQHFPDSEALSSLFFKVPM